MSVQLEISNLSYQFPTGLSVLRQLNISFRKGEFVVLAGANGCGKTVFARHLNGLFRPTSGKILLNGRDIFDDIHHTRTKIGLVFQDPDSQFIGETVEEDIAFGPENLRLAADVIRQRVEDAMTAVGLVAHAKRRPYQLSGGQKRKLAIAGVLAMQPEIIVFDEPFTGLDYGGVIQVLEELIKLKTRQTTIIVITHDLGKIVAHADRLVLMCDGQIAQDGQPVDIIEKVEAYGIRQPRGTRHDIKSMTWLK